MFAGSRISFAGAALINHPIVRRSQVVSEVEKAGRSGPLLFVTIEHLIESGDQEVIREIQDIVYRPSSSITGKLSEELPKDIGPEWTWGIDVKTDPTLLFRFSALTYNAHRIHYDGGYARDVEGYPGLVVQGPLQAIGLAELCRRFASEDSMSSFRFRALRPMFEGSRLRLRGRRQGPQVHLASFDDEGQMTMEATAELTT
jgi:3-methylfumaryl-CoA hydratase